MITPTLRILLFVISVLTGVYIGRGLRKSRIRIEDTLYWLFFAAVLILMSMFPSVVIVLAGFFGVITPANFVFLVMFFLLLIRCFLLSLQVSWLEEKMRTFIEESAVREALRHTEGGESGLLEGREKAASSENGRNEDGAREDCREEKPQERKDEVL